MDDDMPPGEEHSSFNMNQDFPDRQSRHDSQDFGRSHTDKFTRPGPDLEKFARSRAPENFGRQQADPDNFGQLNNPSENSQSFNRSTPGSEDFDLPNPTPDNFNRTDSTNDFGKPNPVQEAFNRPGPQSFQRQDEDPENFERPNRAQNNFEQQPSAPENFRRPSATPAFDIDLPPGIDHEHGDVPPPGMEQPAVQKHIDKRSSSSDYDRGSRGDRTDRDHGDDEFGSHAHNDGVDSPRSREYDRDRERRRDFDRRGPTGNYNNRWRGPPRGGYGSRGPPNTRYGMRPDYRRGPPPRGYRGAPPGMYGGPRWDGHGPMDGPRMGGPMGPGPTPNNPMFTDVDGEVWIEYKNDQGRPYYYNCKTQKTVWTKPKLKDVLGQQQNVQQGVASAMNPAIRMPSMGQGGMPPRFPGIHPFIPPDMAAMMGMGSSTAQGVPPKQQQHTPDSPKKPTWTEHKTDAGKPYYYNTISKQSVWDRPKEMDEEPSSETTEKEEDEAPKAKISIPGIPDSIAPAIMAARAAAAALAANLNNSLNNSEQQEESTPIHRAPSNERYPLDHSNTSTRDAPMEMQRSVGGGIEGRGGEGEGDIGGREGGGGGGKEGGEGREGGGGGMDVDMDEETSDIDETTHAPVQEKNPEDANKPVAINSVIGTPWCVVWTGDKRSFFYNAVSKESHWVMPDELKDNEQVEKLLDQPPKPKETAPPAEDPPARKKPKIAVSETKPVTKPIAAKPDGIIINISSAKAKSPDKNDKPEKKEPMKYQKDNMTLEERQGAFREMLLDREVSAFSTWDKELHKIVFDPRYLLLSARERKLAYEAFIKSRAEDERIEKRNKIKDNRETFKKLIDKANLSSRATFSEFAQKFGKDPKFKAIEKMREREHLFNEWKADQADKKGGDEVKEETKDARESSRDSRDRKTSRDSRSKDIDSKESKIKAIKEDFLEMLKSGSCRISLDSSWSKKKKYFSDDVRYITVGSSTLREDYFYEYTKNLDKKDPAEVEAERRANERKEREQTALREREREVARKQVDQSREWERERGAHAREEAQQHFLALLHDMVRDADASWRKTRKQLREDGRWELAALLEPDQKESMFTEHIESLSNKRKKSFRRLIDECEQVTLTSVWKEIRRKIKHDARYSKFSEDDKEREAEFQKYIKEKTSSAKSDFRQLLKEIKCISYKSKDMLRGANGDAHMREIRQFITNDKRGLVLDDIPDDRDRILDEHITELDKCGPPPPPTATRPSKR